MSKTYTTEFHDGVYIGRVEQFPYLIAIGETEDEALEKIKKKVEHYLSGDETS